MNKDNEKDNLLTANFKSDCRNQPEKPAKISSNQTNPVYKILFKFLHKDLNSSNDQKGFFARFDPKDLF